MGNSGQIPPTMFAQAEEGMLIFMPDGMRDAEAKDDFVTKVRLIAASYDATAVVLVLESWVTMAKQGQKLEMSPPSESHERQEMVVLIGEAKNETWFRFLPIVRSDNGKFWSLGEPQRPDADSFQGRFSQLLPPEAPDEATRRTGMAMLTALGGKITLVPRDAS
jgi:hypothetical protein